MEKNLSAKQLSTIHNIPIDHVRAAKVLECPAETDNRWKYSVFEPWYKTNLPQILELITSDKKGKGKVASDWGDRKKRAEALIAEIKLKEMEQETLYKSKVIPTLNNIATAQRIMLTNGESTLIPKLIGKDLTTSIVRYREFVNEICNLFQSQLSEWTKQGTKDNGNSDTDNRQ